MHDQSGPPNADAHSVIIDGLFAISDGNLVLLLEEIELYDRHELWKQDGVCSMTDWVTYRRNMSRRDAHELVTVARALRDLPAIKAALGESRLCLNKVVILTTFVTPDEDEYWADEAQKYTFAQLEHIAKWKRRIMRQDAERTIDRRYLRFSHDKVDGSLKLNARLPAADGAAVQKASSASRSRHPPGRTEPTTIKAAGPMPSSRWHRHVWRLTPTRTGRRSSSMQRRRH